MDKNEVAQFIDKKIDEYLKTNMSEVDIIKCNVQKQLLLTYFLFRDLSKEEKGGLVAIRGFIYQYYAFIYYCLEMMDSSKWDTIIFELGDDISLIGEKKIMFIQVKTEREDNFSHYINPIKLVARENDFNSWLDKLFLYKNKIDNYFEDVTDIEFAFKVSTNMSLNASDNYKTDIFMVENIPSNENIKKRLEKPLTIKKGKKVETIDASTFYSEGSIDWYLERFSIDTLGITYSLSNKIEQKIQKIYNEDSSDVRQYVIRNFMNLIIQRTFSDVTSSLESKENFIFSKSFINKSFEDLIKKGNLENSNRICNDSLVLQFNNIFIELQVLLTNNYVGEVQRNLIETIVWLSSELKAVSENDDPYIYEKFLNRVFLLENGNVSLIDISKNRTYVVQSLLYLIYGLSVHNENNLVVKENIKAFINICKRENDDILLTIYNGQDSVDSDNAKYKLINMKNGSNFLKTINKNLICILVDVKEPMRSNRFEKLSELKISSINKGKILSESENIKFIYKKDIQGLWDEVAASKLEEIDALEIIKTEWRKLEATTSGEI